MSSILLSEILPKSPAWTTTITDGALILLAPNHLEVERLIDRPMALSQLINLAKHLKAPVKLSSVGSSRSMSVLGSMDSFSVSNDPEKYVAPLSGLVTEAWLDLAIQIKECNEPCFLVSIAKSKNIFFNGAALDLLGYRPDQAHILENKGLTNFWGKKEPGAYKRKIAPPSKLLDLNTELMGRSSLPNHRYSNWKEDYNAGTTEWVEWRSDIDLITLPDGHLARRMICHEYKPVSAPVTA